MSSVNDNENNYEATLPHTNSVTHQHPVGPGELGIHAEDATLLVRDVAEDLVHSLRGQRDLLPPSASFHKTPYSHHLRPHPSAL